MNYLAVWCLSYVLRLVYLTQHSEHTTILSLHFMFPFRELQRNILTILIIFSFNSCMLLVLHFKPLTIHLSPPTFHHPPSHQPTITTTHQPLTPPPPPASNNSPSPSSHHLTSTQHPNHLPHKGWKPCSLSSRVFV